MFARACVVYHTDLPHAPSNAIYLEGVGYLDVRRDHSCFRLPAKAQTHDIDQARRELSISQYTLAQCFPKVQREGAAFMIHTRDRCTNTGVAQGFRLADTPCDWVEWAVDSVLGGSQLSLPEELKVPHLRPCYHLRVGKRGAVDFGKKVPPPENNIALLLPHGTADQQLIPRIDLILSWQRGREEPYQPCCM